MSKHLLVRAALGVSLLIAIVAAPSTAFAANPSSGAPPTVPQVASATAGGAWLESQFNSSGYIPLSGSPDQPDLSSTANAVLALASVGDDAVALEGLDYLSQTWMPMSSIRTTVTFRVRWPSSSSTPMLSEPIPPRSVGPTWWRVCWPPSRPVGPTPACSEPTPSCSTTTPPVTSPRDWRWPGWPPPGSSGPPKPPRLNWLLAEQCSERRLELPRQLG